MRFSRTPKIILLVAVAFSAGFLTSQQIGIQGGRTDQIKLLQHQNESLRAEIERLNSK